MKKLLLLSLVICCYSFNINAQKNTVQKEKREMFFRITAVKKITNDSIIASIAGGSKQGLENGSTGIVKGVYKSGDDRSDLEIGFASIFKLTDSIAYITIRPIDKTGGKKDYEIRKGDYVKLNIKVPKLSYRSILFELALLDIQFNNLYKEPLYDINDLLYRDSKQLEDSLMSEGAKDVFKTYNGLKDDTSFNSLKIPMKEGRYYGRSVFDVMRDCKAKDVFTFLHFVKNYPGKYIGNTWKLNETFATWVMNKAPYSNKEIYDSVLAYKNNANALKQFLSRNIEMIKKERFVENWIDKAQEEAEKDNLVEAQSLFEVAKLVLPYLQDNCMTGYYYYNYSSIYESKKEYKKAIVIYDSAFIYFDKCGNDYYKAQTLLKKGLTYYNMESNDEALRVFETMMAEVNKSSSTLKPLQKASFSARYNYFSGILQAIKGELKKAVTHYENAIKNYKEIGNYSSMQTITMVQGRLARLYKKQGELAKASEIYNEQLKVYNNLNDRKNIADVLYNIGDIQFELANYRAAMQYFKSSQQINISFNDLDNASLAESMIAQSYYGLGKYDSAIAGHTKAIDYRKQSGSKSGMAFSWKKLGSLYNKSGEKNKSLAAYDSAAYYYTITKDSSRLKDLLSDIGDVYYNDKQYQKAFATYFKWHQLNIATKNKSDLANSFYQLAAASFNFNLDTAKFYYNNCMTTAKEIGDKSNEMYASLGLGYVSYKEYDYAAGEKYFSNALQLAIKEKNKKQEANSYRMIASAYSSKLDFDKALFYYKKSIALYDSIGEKSSIPSIYNNVASALQTKGDFAESKQWYLKTIDLAEKINSKYDIGYAYNGLSFLYVLQGDLVSAQKAADSCKAVFKEVNNNWQIADSYIIMGIVSNYKNDYESAVQYYKAADSLFTLEKDDWSRSTCQNNIGNVYYFQADYDNALKFFFESEKLLSKIKFISESHIMAKTNIGEVYYYKKDYAKAEKYMLEGFKLAKEKNAGRMLNSANIMLGMLYYDTKKYAESEKYLLEGLSTSKQMNHSDNIIMCGLYLGKLYNAQNNTAKGFEYFRNAVQFAKNYKSSKYAWELLYEYGLSFYNQQKYDSAITSFKQAVELVEEGSQKLFGGAEAKKIYNADSRKVDLYNKLVASLAKTNNKEDALYYADKSNNQAIKEQTEKAGIATTDKAKEEAIKKGGELLQKQNAVDQAIAKEKTKPEAEQNKQLIASLESIQKVAQKDYINYINGLVKKYPDMQAYFSKTNPADFKNSMRYIPDSTLAVLYIINDNQLFVFTATKQEIGIKTIELKQDINKQAERLLGILKNPLNVTGTGAIRLRSTIKSKDGIKGDFKTEASILYDMLITPIKDQMKDKKNICIIPNGKLSNIPFQSLGTNDAQGNFHFLVEDYAIFYTNKMDIFSKPHETANINKSFIALGNPDKSLPNASEEVKNFSGIVKNAAIYTEGEATETKATEGLSNYQYVHFATHGILDYAEFEKSYLVFAPEKNASSDGKLTIEKINGLTISNCSLVTLSACETAVSKEAVKGWYISPANSFLQNNVSSVVASLWQVDDKATSVLMTEFYKNLSTMPKVEALRKAQETLSKNPEYSHPYFWSAFVLYGEWR